MPEILRTYLPAIGALTAVVALVLVAGRVVQRLGLGRTVLQGTTHRLTIQDTLHLDRTRRLHVIRCDERELLLISGGTGAETVIGWLPVTDGQA